MAELKIQYELTMFWKKMQLNFDKACHFLLQNPRNTMKVIL